MIDRIELFMRIWWEEGPAYAAFDCEDGPGAHCLMPHLEANAGKRECEPANEG